MDQILRTYLPGTLATIADLRARRELAPGPAYAVTPALRVEVGDADQEELEYEAFARAARASLELLRASDPDLPRRRVVIAVDAPGRPQRGARVTLGAPVPLARVVAIHLDGARAEPEVAAAAIGETDDVEYELEWYDVSELDQLPGWPD